jgi:flagellar biosynthetic protein FlhB
VPPRKDDKTEKPTERRRKQARQEGQNARSQEVGVAFSLVAAVVALRIIGPGAVDSIIHHSKSLFGEAGRGLDGGAVGGHVVAMVLAALVPFLMVTVGAGIVGGLSQVGFTFAPKALKPKLSHLSPKKGIEKFKPAKAGWELGRSLLKLGLLGLILWEPMVTWIKELAQPIGLAEGLRMTADQTWALLVRAALLAVVIAAADFAINKRRSLKDIKMTRQEVRDEAKNTEGDAGTKARRKRLHRELSRNRMIGEVGGADVVITNPTHLSVALRYERGEPAPRVIAKGAGKLAERIRIEARRHGVPVIERKPLARALFRTVNVGTFVPADLFEAVAVVLATAYRRRRRVA